MDKIYNTDRVLNSNDKTNFRDEGKKSWSLRLFLEKKFIS